MNNVFEILIPYYRSQEGLERLLKSIFKFSILSCDINISCQEKIDFKKEKYQNKNFKINYIIDNEKTVETRLYKYLSNTKYNKTLIIHSDVEILDYDPISDIINLSESNERIALIGKHRSGQYVADGGFLPPTLGSHFLLSCNKIMRDFYKKALEEEHINYKGFTKRNVDIFPTRAYQLSIASFYQCLSLPLSIECKTMHYNSSTRRKNLSINILNNNDSIRATQIDIDGGMINIKNKIDTLDVKRDLVIIGVGEDAIATLEYFENKKIFKEIYFYEQLTTIQGTKFKNKNIISFIQISKLDPLPFIYICVPNYQWFCNFFNFSGMRYGLDYKVRLNYGHELHHNEHLTYHPSKINNVYIRNQKVIEPNNMFLDSGNNQNLSYYHLFNYSIIVFFHSIRSSLKKIFTIFKNE